MTRTLSAAVLVAPLPPVAGSLPRPSSNAEQKQNDIKKAEGGY